MDNRYEPQNLSFDKTNTLTHQVNYNSEKQPEYNTPNSSRSYTPDLVPQANNYSPLSNPQQQQQQQPPPPQQPPYFNQGNAQPSPQQSPYPGSAQTTRTNTWVQTPAGPYPTGQVYFSGPVDSNGYPVDVKDRGSQPENPFNDPPPQPPSFRKLSLSADIEKEKHDDGHGKGGWDYHSKIPHKKDPNQPHLPFGERLRHFTWAWYTLTMATGGISTLISIQPHAFPGLITIGAIFYIINLMFFSAITSTMIIRFTKFSGSFKASITHEREGLFLGPFFLSIATIITGTQKYVIQSYEADHPNRAWAVTSIAVAFWAYTFCTFCLATFQYSFLFCCHTYKLTSFMPSWLLPIFPIMLAGTIASVIAADQPVASRMPILAAGLGCQGLGFTIAILMYAHYIGRLMQVGYPGREHRGAMFIGVGPPSFTCLALIGMANALPDDFDLQGDGLVDAKLLRTMALVVALFLWVLAMWFFMITLVAVIHQWALYFHLGWWAMVFPNTGFVIATISIGNALQDEVVLFVGNGLTIAIVCMWFYVLFNHIQAVYVGDIMYPMMDEDNADH
ncbi:voltage-dependent anion channel-domain-containing protein [Phaeosphaeriaceae sp. PMI808]|nr:voltage-dependent anion channel-domain-containing protein [Phaeosphaeriaceae sp. PMI808]